MIPKKYTIIRLKSKVYLLKEGYTKPNDSCSITKLPQIAYQNQKC